MRRRLSTRLYRYDPRLLSRSTTILKPSSKTCCSIVWRTFEGAIGFSVSRLGVRFRVEGVSARTGAILIRDRKLLRRRGQRSTGILPGRRELRLDRRDDRQPHTYGAYVTPCPDA